MHGRRRTRWRLQEGVGPVVLGLIIVVWVLLLWLGWTLIFAANPDTVVPASDTIGDGF